MLKGSDVVTASVPKVNLLISRGKIWILTIIVILFVLLVGGMIRAGESQYASISTPVAAVLKGQKIAMQLADTDAKRQKGLSDQKELPAGQGMLFVFDAPANHCFWMKDMNFSIDIIWFDAQKKLVDQVLSATPTSYPKSFCPKSDAIYVVELNAGAATKLGLRFGDQLEFKVL